MPQRTAGKRDDITPSGGSWKGHERRRDIVPVCVHADLINVLCQTDAFRAPSRRTGCSICGAQVFVTRPS